MTTFSPSAVTVLPLSKIGRGGRKTSPCRLAGLSESNGMIFWRVEAKSGPARMIRSENLAGIWRAGPSACNQIAAPNDVNPAAATSATTTRLPALSLLHQRPKALRQQPSAARTTPPPPPRLPAGTKRHQTTPNDTTATCNIDWAAAGMGAIPPAYFCPLTMDGPGSPRAIDTRRT